MLIRVCTAKLHNVTVTEANPNYKGSITIGADLLDASNILPGQMVIINNGENGHTWQTYVMKGKPGVICLNGRPPSHHFEKGHKVIVLAEAWIDHAEYKANLVQTVVLVDGKNKITQTIRKPLHELSA
jgi:aspartate 1-decarboxylase